MRRSYSYFFLKVDEILSLLFKNSLSLRVKGLILFKIGLKLNKSVQTAQTQNNIFVPELLRACDVKVMWENK